MIQRLISKRNKIISNFRLNVLILLVISIKTYNYEPSFLNMQNASTLEPLAFDLTFQHRFNRIIGQKSLYSFFDGANVQFILYGHLWRGIKSFILYGVSDNEFESGIAYGYSIIDRWLSAYGSVSYFSYDIIDDRAQGVFVLFAIQSEIIKERVNLLSNTSYESYNSHVATSIGLLISTWDFLDIIGEYTFTSDEPDLPIVTVNNSYSFGLKLNIGNHHFKFMFTNATAIGPRRALRGASSNDLRFGFSIQRLFEF